MLWGALGLVSVGHVLKSFTKGGDAASCHGSIVLLHRGMALV